MTVPGWCGVSHGESGQMTNSLLLMAWSFNGSVYTSFRYAPGYNAPGAYTGKATLTQISSKVNGTSFEVTYRCQGCLSWDQGGATGKVSTSSKFLIMGRAAGSKAVVNPTCPTSIGYAFHDLGFGQYGAPLDNVPNPSYSAWAALATKTAVTDCSNTYVDLLSCLCI
jgi:cellobiose dehydrogenase (acceptor)